MTEVSKDTAFNSICKNFNNWRKLSKELRSDREFIKKCATIQAKIITFIDFDINTDIDFVFELFKNNNKILIWLHRTFKKNHDFMIQCIEIDHRSYKFVSQSLKNNRNFIIAALKKNPNIILSINISFLMDESIILEPLAENPSLIPRINPFLMTNSLKLNIVKLNGLALQYLDQFKLVHIYAALKQNYKAYAFIPDRLIENIQFIRYVLHEINGLMFVLIAEKFKTDDLLIMALKNNPNLLHILPLNVKYKHTVMTISYILKNDILNEESFLPCIKRNYFEFVKIRVLEYNAFITFLCACYYNKYIEKRIKKQKTDKNILNKLNKHGIYFADMLKKNIFEYMFSKKKYIKLLRIIAQKEKLC